MVETLKHALRRLPGVTPGTSSLHRHLLLWLLLPQLVLWLAGALFTYNLTARYANHVLVNVGQEEVYLDFTSGDPGLDSTESTVNFDDPPLRWAHGSMVSRFGLRDNRPGLRKSIGYNQRDEYAMEVSKWI